MTKRCMIHSRVYTILLRSNVMLCDMDDIRTPFQSFVIIVDVEFVIFIRNLPPPSTRGAASFDMFGFHSSRHRNHQQHIELWFNVHDSQCTRSP